MAGLTGLGSLAHDLETQLETFSGAADSVLFAQILQCQDAILAGVKQGRAIAAGELPQAAATAPAATIVAQPVVETIVETIVETAVEPAVETMAEAITRSIA